MSRPKGRAHYNPRAQVVLIIFHASALYRAKNSALNWWNHSSLVPRPSRAPRERGSGIIRSEFLVVLSQRVRKTGNPIRLLGLKRSCDIKRL